MHIVCLYCTCLLEINISSSSSSANVRYRIQHIIYYGRLFPLKPSTDVFNCNNDGNLVSIYNRRVDGSIHYSRRPTQVQQLQSPDSPEVCLNITMLRTSLSIRWNSPSSFSVLSLNSPFPFVRTSFMGGVHHYHDDDEYSFLSYALVRTSSTVLDSPRML